jgi:all-trans-8'-apo-beta-carotenal 15,15'-oxygenase
LAGRTVHCRLVRRMSTPMKTLCSENLVRSHGFESLEVEGRLPESLRGTLYRTGPGLFDSFGRRYKHIFEADGAITAVRIADGKARGAVRILDTAGLLEERSAGRPRYGSPASWPRRMINAHLGRKKNTANTNVTWLQEQLVGLMEAAPPTEVDPEELTVRGEIDFRGAIKGALCAHPHRVPARKASYGFGLHYGRKTTLDFYEFPDLGAARHLGSFGLKAAPMLHDFVATENHLVFLVPPAVVSVPRVMLQIGSFEDLFQWRPELGTFVLVVPIDRPTEPIKFSIDPFFQWHFVNGFERDGRIVVDLLHHVDFKSFIQIGRGMDTTERGGTYRRAELDLSAKSIRFDRVFDVPADFPRIHPAVQAGRHRYAWMVTSGAPPKLVRVESETGNTEAYQFDEHERASEAVVVPTGEGELDAYALSLVYDAKKHKTALAVFDAKSIASGPIARAWFDHHIPITFHGSWVAA